MTPATQHELWGTGEWVFPRDPVASDSRISWTRTWPEVPDHWPGSEKLLDDFCNLSHAQPVEMAAFVARYAMPEVKQGEVSEGRDNPMGFRVLSARAGWISVHDLRDHARAFGAARRLGADLIMRRPGEPEDWVELQGAGLGVERIDPEDLDDWKLGRERFARWLSRLLRETDVGTTADWLGARGLALEPLAGTFLGAIALMLARETGAEGAYSCDSCGARVQRSRRRPPRKGERVYCDRPECKREQQRRNQAAWRARDAAKRSS